MSKSKERKGMTKIIEIRGPSLQKTTTQFRFYNLSLSLHHFTFSVFLVRQSLSSTSWTPALCLKPYSFRLISRRNDSLLPVIPLKVMVRTTNSHLRFSPMKISICCNFIRRDPNNYLIWIPICTLDCDLDPN